MIRPKDICTGDLLFLQGETLMAEQIMVAQQQRGFNNWHLNHVGSFIWINGILCVAEEDYPGRFDINPFHEQYVKKDAIVYHGKINNGVVFDEDDLIIMSNEFLVEASNNKLFDYAFLDIVAFKFNALMWKLFKWDVWIGRKKNKKDKYTCSQRTTKFLQDYHNIFFDLDPLKTYPAELADSKLITLSKILF